jgi:KRAB domain-containing zinc finger protein
MPLPLLAQLVRHSRVHTKDRPFACTRCGVRFTQKSSLKMHLAKHEEINFPPPMINPAAHSMV